MVQTLSILLSTIMHGFFFGVGERHQTPPKIKSHIHPLPYMGVTFINPTATPLS